MPNDQSDKDIINLNLEQREEIANASGIGSKRRATHLVFNSPSATVVIAVEAFSDERFERHLFFRNKADTKYQIVGNHISDVHYSDVITSQVLPVVYYKATRVRNADVPGEFAGDWLSIQEFNLTTKVAKDVVTKEGVKFPDPFKHGWVFRLHGVSSDDKILYCTCGLQKANDRKIYHWLCGVVLGSQDVSLISKLESIWF